MTGEREYLGDAKIYGVRHQVYAWHRSVPEHEVDYTNEETGERYQYTKPPCEQIEIEFSSLALSHATGHNVEVLSSLWHREQLEVLRTLYWSQTARAAWIGVHERLEHHPMLSSAQAAERAVDAINAAGGVEGHQVEARRLGLDDE